MAYCVYMHVNKTNGKRYVGITSKKPEARWGLDGSGYKPNKHFTNAIKKYGWDGFDHIVVARDLSKEDACSWEIALIAMYGCNKYENGYNGSEGGENPATGAKHSEEWKKQKSEFQRGRRHSEESRLKISMNKKGKPNGLEGRKGMDCAKAGLLYQIDEITKNVISVFYGYDDMRRQTGFAKTPVRETVSGKRRRAYGYIWKYEKRGEQGVTI